MLPMTTPVEEILSIDAQIKFLENLLKLNNLLAEIRDRIDGSADFESWVDEPGSGAMLNQLKGLLLALQGDLISIPKLVAGLDAGLAAAGEITAAVDAITRWIYVIETAETASGEDKVKNLGELFSDWTTLLGAIGHVLEGFSVNPLIGIYFMLIGKAIAGIAVSVGKLEAAVEIRNEAIRVARGLDPTLDPEAETEEDDQRTAILAYIEELKTKRDGLIAEAGDEYREEVAAALLACAIAFGISLADIDSIRETLSGARKLLSKAWAKVQKLKTQLSALRISGGSDQEIEAAEAKLQTAGEELRSAYEAYNTAMKRFNEIASWLRRYFSDLRSRGETSVEDWWLDDHYDWISDTSYLMFSDLGQVKLYLQTAGLLKASRFAILTRIGLTGLMGRFPGGGICALVGVIGIGSLCVAGVILAASLGWFGLGSDAAVSIDVPAEPVVIAEIVQPTMAPTSTTLPTPTLSPIEKILLTGNFTEEQKAQILIAYLLDPEGDWIIHLSDAIVEVCEGKADAADPTDIRGHLGVRLSMSQPAVEITFNMTYFPCDSEIPGGFVVCTENAGPIPAGDVYMFVMKLAGDLPAANPDHFFTYAVVVDADGDLGNNFTNQYPYDWDYFQNTDRWYNLNWDPNTSKWDLSVADVVMQLWPAPSAARAVVVGDTVTFFVPGDEITAEEPGYRLTAFGHDGYYTPSASIGDVTGANPTEPLTPVGAQAVIID
jgi:hypothetical protein